MSKYYGTNNILDQTYGKIFSIIDKEWESRKTVGVISYTLLKFKIQKLSSRDASVKELMYDSDGNFRTHRLNKILMDLGYRQEGYRKITKMKTKADCSSQTEVDISR